jgi:lipopolysaccharide/colanic/teichoic acid biosynthesis glycosyltransferase
VPETLTPTRSARQRRTVRPPFRAIPLGVCYRMKPIFDLSFAAILFVGTLPLMVAALLLVRLTSPGNPLYRQTRLGRGGVPFTIYKIRTMRFDAEAKSGPQWSKPGDARITPIGRILRVTHLDELPQLWNVLRGDMSLVGPRPERPEIAAGLRRTIPGYDARLAVKPGMTGLAQVHLPPDETIDSVRTKLVYDRVYIWNQTFSYDIYLLVCTALKVCGLRRLYRLDR